MLPFSTEFPVKSQANRAAFLAELIAWLHGTSYSTVLKSGSETDLDAENAHLRSASGEELRLRELGGGDDWTAIGFRHDNPDEDGRLWRTEGVLRRAVAEDEQDLVRLRTQCIAVSPGAKLETPRKPYLVKALLKNGWGGVDGKLAVSDQPVWLSASDDDVTLARLATLGEATKWLPTVYISATGNGTWLLTEREIEKLAYDLGGIAHVLVEPDRTFSYGMRDETEGRNAYGGTVGLSAPAQGIVRRFYLGWQIQDARELATTIRVAASNLRAQMPAFGWDWTELQEQALRAQRERDKSRLTTEESEQLYLEEIENLQDKVQQMEQMLAARPADGVGTDEGEFSTDNLVRRIGPEVYAGEISDRLRLAAKTALALADQVGLDDRSRVMLQRFVDRVPPSPALFELLGDITRATRDGRRLADEVTSLLGRHGYRKKADNKHVRLEVTEDYDGLATITLPKTPSDNRSLKNQQKQIERGLGLTKLNE